MKHGIADPRILSMIGLMVAMNPAWSQAPGVIDPQTPPVTGTSQRRVPVNMQVSEIDVGDTSGGLASCRPRYSTEAKQIGPATGDQEKDSYGFTVIGLECPAPR
ncbi:hypothetical protein [Teichococcus oryzae]|uniref:Uncharacterized protein n=1 Tax=Teichococcus oryzae TaxID=1608942 RepID=A0A5B2TEX9_9PROT|nr:hypothetical protein [Pseudoroseomonas oryzae]KAA2212448.1 hypothetical protein F0Q34_14005 [Pseudoroseomonas oryzae]